MHVTTLSVDIQHGWAKSVMELKRKKILET